MKTLLPVLVCAFSAGALAQPASAPDAAALHVKTMAAACAACHAVGSTPANRVVVARLVGRPSDVLAQRMREFKSGARPATVMQQIMRGYSEAQIDQLAAYFAAQKP